MQLLDLIDATLDVHSDEVPDVVGGAQATALSRRVLEFKFKVIFILKFVITELAFPAILFVILEFVFTVLVLIVRLVHDSANNHFIMLHFTIEQARSTNE